MLFSLRYGCNVYIFHQLRYLDQQTIERLNGTNICISHYRERGEGSVQRSTTLWNSIDQNDQTTPNECQTSPAQCRTH